MVSSSVQSGSASDYRGGGQATARYGIQHHDDAVTHLPRCRMTKKEIMKGGLTVQRVSRSRRGVARPLPNLKFEPVNKCAA